MTRQLVAILCAGLGFLILIFSLIVATSPTSAADTCPSDINSDGTVDRTDYNLFRTDFRKSPFSNPKSDINADGQVNLFDYALLFQDFGKTCTEINPPPPTTTPTPPPTLTPSPTDEPTPPTLSGFNLINADTGTTIQSLQNGQTINLDTLPTNNLNIEAVVTGSVESVKFASSDLNRTENGPPYTYAGDDNGTFNAWQPEPGVFALIATPFSQDNGQGTEGNTISLQLNFERPAVTTPTVTDLILVNTDTDSNIRTLSNGDTIDLSDIGSGISILAKVSGPSNRLRFDYNGQTHTEYTAPYTIATNDKTDYRPWSAPTGTYQLTATPEYDSGGQQATGQSLSITITVQP